LQRVFRVTEKAGLRFRGEFFNILNHPNFANPTNLLTNGLFGRSTQTYGGATRATGDELSTTPPPGTLSLWQV
jgi:hypothetical protein